VGSLFSPVDGGVDWKYNGSEINKLLQRITLTGNVELLALPASSGLSEKSFVIALHLRLSSLPADFLELEPDLLLFDWKTPVNIFLFSLFSAKASNPAEPNVVELSLFWFGALDSTAVGSGLSGIVSWTSPRSSESRPVSETFPGRDRDLPLPDRVIIASILSLLSSSLGVGREEKVDVVIVGDSAGRLDLVVSECVLRLSGDLPRVTSPVASVTTSAAESMTIGGGRLLSRGDGVEGISDNSADEDEGESGRGIVRGSTGPAERVGESTFTILELVRGNG